MPGGVDVSLPPTAVSVVVCGSWDGCRPGVVSFSPLMGESCVSGMDVGLAGGGVYGQLSRPGEAGGE